MTEQEAWDQAECSAWSVQMPQTLHIDVPQVEVEDVCLVISTCLAQIKRGNWRNISCNFLTSELLAELASYCMDIVQALSEAILDVVVPQVYRYMKIYGTFSSSVLSLTEDRIHIYLGDSIEQALAHCLNKHILRFVATKEFSQLLLKHIAKTVDSVLALFTRTPIQESKIPLFFVSSCVICIRDLLSAAIQLSKILVKAHTYQQLPQISTPSPSCQTAVDKISSGENGIWFSYRYALVDLLTAYVIHMVNVLRNQCQTPQCDKNDRRDFCFRVGTNTQCLTVEDSDSHGKQFAMSSYGHLDDLPGAVPHSNNAISCKSCLFDAVAVFEPSECQFNYLDHTDAECIEIIVAQLVEDLLETAQPQSSGLESIDKVKVRKCTDRLFNLVMRGRIRLSPSVPVGTRMCDTVIYRKLRTGDHPNPEIVRYTLYMRTEEFVHRCAVLILLWSELNRLQAFSTHSTEGGTEETNLRHYVGDNKVMSCVHVSNESNSTDETPSPEKQSDWFQGAVFKYMISLLTVELLMNIGIQDQETVNGTVRRTVAELPVEDDLRVSAHLSLLSQHHNDISLGVLNHLQLEFGSAQAMQDLLTRQDPTFMEAIVRAFMDQLTCPASPVPHENTAKKISCSVQTSTVVSPISDQDNGKLEDEDESLKDRREQQRCPVMRRIAASTRKFCSSSKKMFSSIARALTRPFIACCRPELE